MTAASAHDSNWWQGRRRCSAWTIVLLNPAAGVACGTRCELMVMAPTARASSGQQGVAAAGYKGKTKLLLTFWQGFGVSGQRLLSNTVADLPAILSTHQLCRPLWAQEGMRRRGRGWRAKTLASLPRGACVCHLRFAIHGRAINLLMSGFGRCDFWQKNCASKRSRRSYGQLPAGLLTAL